MESFPRILKTVWEWLAFLSLLVSFSMLILQVISRYVFNLPVIWTNEIATLAFMWLVFVGAISSVFENKMIRTDLFVGFFSETLKKSLETIFQLLFLVVALISIPAALSLVKKMHILKFDFSEIPYSTFYLAGFFFFSACVPACLRNIVQLWKPERDNNGEG